MYKGMGSRYRMITHSRRQVRSRGQHPGHVSGQSAKAMLCKSKDDTSMLILVALPGDRKLDFKKVAHCCRHQEADAGPPDEAERKTGCVIGPLGAIPPFS
ncbi:hypothetical protein Tamer19_04980 [Cupriavidus sp. TA19]|nr:hypothetical protein Tamer19_04980 [Cupriavidus sp. TA19]